MPVGQEVPQMTDETNNPPSASLGGRERESLRSSETRYRRLFEAARDGILIVDTASRKITDVNPYMSELFGYSPAELLRRDSEMQLLNRMTDLLQSCNTQEEAYKVITLLGRELFPGQHGCVAVLHAAGLHLETVARWGDETPVEPTFSLEDCWALRRGSFHEITDPQVGLCRHFVHQIETGYLCAPLMVQGEILGLLCLVGATAGWEGKHRVSQQQLTVMVGESIKLCLSNLKLREKLHAQAIHDPLTGLFNRRHLEDSLSRELHRAHRRNSPLGVAMLDLDHFKRFNDTFGHNAGDSLLHELGRLLREKVRQSDISCRYGGEEFVLILPDSS